MTNSQPNSRAALARVFPAFGRPGQPIDARSPSLSIPDESATRLIEPGVPPAVKPVRASAPRQVHATFSAAPDLVRPRLGQISFVNCLPVVLPIERQHVQMDAEVVLESPSKLNQMFEDGTLEIGAMSSFYFLSKHNLTLCPDISIACRGPVGSVLLFCKRDPSQLTHGRIVTSAQSATSINLLRILFAEQFGKWPEMVADAHPDIDYDEYDGALVIGDRALEVDTNWSQRYARIDMGAWWFERYKVPMVFGVWAARASWVDKNHYRFAEICRALRTAKLLGLGRRWKDTIYEAHRRTGLSLSRLERYYREELDFDFEIEHSEGLALYQSLLRKYNLLV